MHDISLAFVWHQHQPYYNDDVAGENPMPWVRLHGTKDYWGMAMHLKEVPEVHATINLVPSLLDQILAYTDRNAEDTHLRVSRLAPDALTEDDMIYLLDNFFMVHHDEMIRPFPRYQELYLQRGMGIDSAKQASKRFKKRDIVDLQCWSNLAWMHPIAFEVDSDLQEFKQKGRNYTEQDKAWLLDKQMEILRQVIPLHRELAEQGQVELTTTPFYHPILPLLVDKRLARQAMPEVMLPANLESYMDDARRHLEQGVAMHKKVFGMQPKGMWPSEGSVCQEIISAIADVGIKWIATDEEILACSSDGWVSRDGQGYLRNPEMLYRPWRVSDKGKQLQIIFRDHAMSDQIGFHYQRFDADHAADDFIGKLQAIGNATGGNAGHRPSLVNITLDGENCWEYYPGGGVNFLRKLYHRIAKHPKVTAERVCDYLEKYPATDKISHLFAGSWIQHNFAIWIGHPECNRAWDLLHEARAHFMKAAASGKKTKKQIAQAQRELDIAEGSDWFWWFGDDHSSSQDATFDRLFRQHLQNIYQCLGDEVPSVLTRPISQGHVHRKLHTDPNGLLQVKIDGRHTYFEWINAGHYACGKATGAMAMAADSLLADLYFGFDIEKLYVRLDAREGTVADRLKDIDTLRLRFTDPAGFELLVSHPSWREPILQLYQNDVPVAQSNVSASADKIIELAVPFATLGATPEDAIRFYVELIANDQPVERAPSEGLIETEVPSPDYELIMWQA